MERGIVLIALFAAIVAILGIVPQITLISGVPITAQSLGVMLCGTVLGAKRGTLAVLLFLFMVAIGLPLLSGGRGGFGVFFGASSGFLFGWLLAAFVAGLVVEKLPNIPVLWAAILGSFLGGIVALYIPGIVGMAVVLDKTLIEAAGFAIPFIPGDLIKVVITGVLTSALAKARPSSFLARTQTAATT